MTRATVLPQNTTNTPPNATEGSGTQLVFVGGVSESQSWTYGTSYGRTGLDKLSSLLRIRCRREVGVLDNFFRRGSCKGEYPTDQYSISRSYSPQEHRPDRTRSDCRIVMQLCFTLSCDRRVIPRPGQQQNKTADMINKEHPNLVAVRDLPVTKHYTPGPNFGICIRQLYLPVSANQRHNGFATSAYNTLRDLHATVRPCQLQYVFILCILVNSS